MEISKQSELIKSSLEEIKGLFSSDTVLGTPIDLKNGAHAIPVSKINLGVASGGVTTNTIIQQTLSTVRKTSSSQKYYSP